MLELLVSLLAVAGGSSDGVASADGRPRPNLLLIVADNWAYPHASIYGGDFVRTPTFDAFARSGAVFSHAFCQVPSCSPSRAVLLTGQPTHRLGPAANLHGDFPNTLPTYTEQLAAAGYRLGYMGKGWGPGRYVGRDGQAGSPLGQRFQSFASFLNAAATVSDSSGATRAASQPWCFWVGFRDPHQPWTVEAESPHRTGLDPDRVLIPAYLPDHPVVRHTIVDYLAEVQRMDAETAEILKQLDDAGLAKTTLVLWTGDNGWQMPHGLANVYDAGTRVPLALRWPGTIEPGQQRDELISFESVAPTLLEAAGQTPPEVMTGPSLLPLVASGQGSTPDAAAGWPKAVFLERERHANVRAGDRTYPVRAIRTRDYLYVQNLEPQRWPAGDPTLHWAVGPYGDVDNTPVKALLLEGRDDPALRPFFVRNFGKRPAEELYELATDPDQVRNLAGQPRLLAAQKTLRTQLEAWRRATTDPREVAAPADLARRDGTATTAFDAAPYYGRAADGRPAPAAKQPAAK